MTIGLIAEYNPFHNGHLYQIEKIKEKYPDATLVLVMSGNFTERGEPSIIDKFKKAKIALQAGIDLIVELPFPFATQSADYFAYGAITLLEKMKVDKVIFGSESDKIEDLEEIVEAQLHNEEFDLLVHYFNKQGYNYPTSLSLALKELTGKVIDTPNDLLGISYLKIIQENNYKIVPETIKRINNYHEEKNSSEISSATSIRIALKEKRDITNNVPSYVIPYLTDLHFIEDYFPYLKYKIITEKDLSIYQTVTEGIDHSMKQEILSSSSYSDFISRLKSKRYTQNKIQRMLLHILVGFTKEKAKEIKEITYIRLLGFSNKGRQYLNQIKKEVDIPILSKINRTKDPMLEFEIDTTKIYALSSKKPEEIVEEEYKNHLNKEEKYD